MEITPIAHIYTDFPEKFGIPRQSGMVPEIRGRIVFLPPYRVKEALRGIEGFSHLWLLFDFSKAHRADWSPTVRPPRLGGNRRVGVFASRSPYRPNPIGLSCVALERVEESETEGTVLHVAGADLVSGTPIYDIKPYLPFADAHPDALCGYAGEGLSHRLSVEIAPDLLAGIPPDKQEALLACLAADPRPAYQSDESRVYGMCFAGQTIRFTVREDVLHVTEVLD